MGHFKPEEIRRKFSYSIIITEEEKTWHFSSTQMLELTNSSHVEADTRIILEALKKKEKAMIINATDTDILILMCYAHSSQICTDKWIMNIESERYVNVNTIQDHFGQLICEVLPVYHVKAGCGTISDAASRGKVRPLNKMIKRKKEELLDTFGNLANPESNLEAAQEFFQTILYSGKKK